MTTEIRLQRTPDGAVWTRGGPGHSLWHRYVCVFGQVRVLARVIDVPAPPAGGNRVDGPGVQVWPLPYYVGPIRYLLRLPALCRALRAGVRDVEAVIVRVPSPIAAVLTVLLRWQRRPYAAEVVGDPHDVLAPGVVRHPLRPLLRRWSAYALRNQCRRAASVSYVTRDFLQSRYPAGSESFTTWYSSLDLRDDDYAPAGRTYVEANDSPALVSIGSLDQLYKGVDVLLDALRLLVETGMTPRLVHVGDGRHRGRLEQQAARAGLTDLVTFVGAVPTDLVRDHLDAADLFVHSSRTEGLPRVLIEAMARGLPAIGTRVGGTPELLDEEQLIPPGDPVALATAIRRLVRDPRRMTAVAARNLSRARDFHRNAQAPRRNAFYASIRADRQPGTIDDRTSTSTGTGTGDEMPRKSAEQRAR